jgi:hypothetical protein
MGWKDRRGARTDAPTTQPCGVPLLRIGERRPGWTVTTPSGTRSITVADAVELSGEEGATDVLDSTRQVLDALPEIDAARLRLEIEEAQRLVMRAVVHELVAIGTRLDRIGAMVPRDAAPPDLLTKLDDVTAAVGRWLDRARVRVRLAEVEPSRP